MKILELYSRYYPATEVQIHRIVLFYNAPYPGMLDGMKECIDGHILTTDLSLLSKAAAVVFHVPTLGAISFPPKLEGQKWVAWSMESRANYPILGDRDFMGRFELTMTYERDATVWCPYFSPDLTEKMLQATEPKTERSPVVYFRSSPFDLSGRGRYAFELMKYVKVDSYGRMLRNRELSDGSGQEGRLATLARYKFTLAFENSIAPDYVTEKFFDPLIAGSVPVYLGAPNVTDFAPGDRCFIDVTEFAGPAAVAARLNALAQDDDAYAEYLSWKASGLRPEFRALLDPLRNSAFSRLCNALD
jgi:Glycosyltransferase family 10 (fucosyltransferase) C-term/Fucosyltransferase, N-terminal